MERQSTCLPTTRRLLPLVLSFAALTVFSTSSLSAQSSGAYTPAQAKDGAALFAAKCSMCHGAKLEGKIGPALAGSTFLTTYNGQTADDLRDFIAIAMPLTAPGSLKPAQVLAVLSYILQQNKFPAGDTPLTEASSKTLHLFPEPFSGYTSFLRSLVTPVAIADWTLTSLREKLIKLGAKVVRHGRYVTFQMAEVAIPRDVFAELLQRIAALRSQPAPTPT
jgi:mono/diheme cytochrome c family protein